MVGAVVYGQLWLLVAIHASAAPIGEEVHFIFQRHRS